MQLAKLAWDVLVASVMTAVALLLAAWLSNNLWPIYVLVFGWWALPPFWLAVLFARRLRS